MGNSRTAKRVGTKRSKPKTTPQKLPDADPVLGEAHIVYEQAFGALANYAQEELPTKHGLVVLDWIKQARTAYKKTPDKEG